MSAEIYRPSYIQDPQELRDRTRRLILGYNQRLLPGCGVVNPKGLVAVLDGLYPGILEGGDLKEAEETAGCKPGQYWHSGSDVVRISAALINQNGALPQPTPSAEPIPVPHSDLDLDSEDHPKEIVKPPTLRDQFEDQVEDLGIGPNALRYHCRKLGFYSLTETGGRRIYRPLTSEELALVKSSRRKYKRK